MEDVIVNCVCKAFGKAVKACKCVRQYRTNLEKLRTEMTSLGDCMNRIEREVGEFNDRGDVVENDVSYWQTKAGTLKSEIDQLVQHSTDNENMHCFTRLCPNIKCRYQMSKQAEQKIPDVQQLIRDSHSLRIGHPRPPPAELEFPSNENYVDFDSRAPIFNKIVDSLKDPEVKMIGLYGLGGVGKTTLVKEVGRKMRSDGNFKQVSLLVVSKDLNVKQIQSKLADSLNLRLDDGVEEKGRAIKLWNKLTNGDNYLVILDDVWDKVDITAIGIPITDGNKRCKVLLTSRNKDLLGKKMKVDKNFQMGELPFPEAWTLFKKKAGNFIESQREINSLAEQVCKKCKGLPVAINALGAALEGEPKHAWANALINLERYMLTNVEGIDPSVCASLRMSYDMLKSPNAQSCFLLCCLFAEDAEISINELTRHCVARRLLRPEPRTFDEATMAVSTTVGTLKLSSLLLNGSNENVVKLHDVIRDVGISIGREDKAFLVDHGALQWPENPVDGPSYEAISLRSGKIKKLYDGLICPQLHTLILHNDKLSDLEVPDNFFTGMKKLTVLILTRLCMWRLPSSLANLTNLRMLYLDECELGDIAVLGDLKNNLEVLGLQGSNITALPQEIGHLTGIRLLDLQDCRELQVIPQGVIANLTNLEELYFPDTFENWEALTDKLKDASNSNNASLDELSCSLSSGQLTTLHIFVPHVMLLPNEGMMFENLKRFRIAVGSTFDYDEEIYSGTRMLKLAHVPFRKELMPLVDKAEVLVLDEVEGLKKELHDRRGGNELCNWKYLKVKSCFDDSECLIGKPKSLVPISHGLHTSSSLDKLTVLIIQKCNFKYLFSESIARGLIHLERLDISSCEIMEEIIRFEGQNDEGELTSKMKFSKLKQLRLYDLPNLISFSTKKEKMGTTMGSSSTGTQPLFSELVIFPVLETLSINEVGNITEIWNKQSISVLQEQGSFCQLKNVKVANCKRLCYVFPSTMHPMLKNLNELSIRDCGSMEGIIVGFEGEQDEDGLENGVTFSKLSELMLWGLPNLISFCTKLGKEGTTERSSSTNNARLLFDKKLAFPALETLDIGNAPNIIEIWNKQQLPEPLKETEPFCKLKDITVENCEQLVYVFPSYMLPWLENLHTLKIKHCKKVEVIASWELKEKEAANTDVIVFPQLKNVALKGLDKLRSFCPGTQVFFSNKLAFPALETLKIGNAPNITEIWNKQQLPEPKKETEPFCKLKDITVENCEQLVYVFPSYMLPWLENLHTLKIKHCKKVEVIVSWELKEKEAANNDVIVFPQLKNVALEGLDKLRSFCPGTQVFFSNKVAFPTLEILFIGKAPNITEIWDKKSLPELEKKIESVCKLKDITVENCEQLVYVLPYYMLPYLKTLQILKIKHCKKVEAIVSRELKEEEAANNDVIVFPQLKNVELEGLDKVRSLCPGTQVFFSNKLAFPALETLKIGNAPNITEIWNKQQLLEPKKEIEPFCKLKDITVENCEQLVYVLPYYMLPYLKTLQILKIKHCKKVEVIVLWELKEKEAANNHVIVFPQLKNVALQGLDKLTSFYSGSQVFFANKVIFPVLETLTINAVGNITEIWDKQSIAVLQKQGSFCQLKNVYVANCERLCYVFPSNMHPLLKNLNELSIRDCGSMEGIIVGFEGEQDEDGPKNGVTFSKLSYLRLWGLPNLISFCTKLGKEGTTERSSSTNNARSLFDKKVAFPALEILNIGHFPNIIEIWDKQPLLEPKREIESFYKLRYLTVWGCEQLVYVFPSYMLPQLKNLRCININDCKEVEVIVSWELKEKEAANDDIVVFPQLKDVGLSGLDKLKSFCSGMQVFFSHKDAFPALVKINLDKNLERFRNGTSTKKVVIEECGTSGKENDHNGEEG